MIRRQFLATLALLAVASLGLAQTGPVSQPAGNSTTGPITQTGPVSQTGSLPSLTGTGGTSSPTPSGVGSKVFLTQNQLETFIRNIDSSFQTFDAGKMGLGYRFVAKHNGMSVPMTITASNGYVWFEVIIGQPKNLAALPNNVLAQLLETQTAIGPTFLCTKRNDNGTLLYLLHRVDRTITTERLTSAVQEFLGDVQNSKATWGTIVG